MTCEPLTAPEQTTGHIALALAQLGAPVVSDRIVLVCGE